MRSLVVFFVFLSGTLGFGQELDQSKFLYIAWKPVEGATKYHVQVQNEKKEIYIDEVTKDSHLPVKKFPEGKYKVRVAPYDIFQKLVVWSAWEDVQVLQSETPLVSASALSVNEKAKTYQLEIQGENLFPATKVELVSKNKKYVPATSKASDDETKLVSSFTEIPSGVYDLVVTNPYKKVFKKDRSIAVNTKEKVEPIVKVEPKPEPKKPVTKKPREYSYEEYASYAKKLNGTCSSSVLPKELILDCYPEHILLDDTSVEKKDLYYFLLLDSTNQDERIRGAKYFLEICPVPVFAKDWGKRPSVSNISEKESNLKEALVKSTDQCSN